MIQKSYIEKVLSETDIVLIVGEYVRLRMTGSTYVGRCPLHREDTPSFTVYPDHFHCYGCGANGNVIGFLMRIENLSFPAAVNKLAARAGIVLSGSGMDADKEAYLRMVTDEMRWWQAKVRRAYLDRQMLRWQFHDTYSRFPVMREDAIRCLNDNARWLRRIERYWHPDGRMKDPKAMLVTYLRYRQRHPEVVRAYRLEMQLANECEAVDRSAAGLVAGLSPAEFDGLLEVIAKKMPNSVTVWTAIPYPPGKKWDTATVFLEPDTPQWIKDAQLAYMRGDEKAYLDAIARRLS